MCTTSASPLLIKWLGHYHYYVMYAYGTLPIRRPVYWFIGGVNYCTIHCIVYNRGQSPVGIAC